jgi:hypothetical protein
VTPERDVPVRHRNPPPITFTSLGTLFSIVPNCTSTIEREILKKSKREGKGKIEKEREINHSENQKQRKLLRKAK